MANGHGGPRPRAGRKPGKVNEATRNIMERAREYGEAALQVLVEVAEDKDAPHSARVSAATALIDRGWGKPKTDVAVTGQLELLVRIGGDEG